MSEDGERIVAAGEEMKRGERRGEAQARSGHEMLIRRLMRTVYVIPH